MVARPAYSWTCQHPDARSDHCSHCLHLAFGACAPQLAVYNLRAPKPAQAAVATAFVGTVASSPSQMFDSTSHHECSCKNGLSHCLRHAYKVTEHHILLIVRTHPIAMNGGGACPPDGSWSRLIQAATSPLIRSMPC